MLMDKLHGIILITSYVPKTSEVAMIRKEIVETVNDEMMRVSLVFCQDTSQVSGTT